MSLFTEQPVAPRFDGKTRDFAVDSATNLLRTTSYVTTMMHLGLCTRKGSWRSSPNIGTELHKIEYLGGDNLQAQVERCVREAEPIATLVRAGKASLVGIFHESTASGALLVSVDFVDLTLDRNRIQRITSE